MKLGMIARADNSGLGIQSWEFHRHMKPLRTLVIDVGYLADDGKHCNKATHGDRYPHDAVMWAGWCPPNNLLREFLTGLDVVYVAETPYNPTLFAIAASMGVRTVLQYNWEFLDRRPGHPTVFASPSTWHYDDLAVTNKVLLPVPIATDRFTVREHPPTARHFVHLVGRPAIHDRNGTAVLLGALEYVRAPVTVTVACQEPGYLARLSHHHRVPPNVVLIVDTSAPENYWDNYRAGDVLVMPRRFGGLCLPVQEAIGAGMPVIMGDQSPNEWLPPDWLVPAVRQGQFPSRSSIDLYGCDPVDLAAKIDEFAQDPVLYARAREHVVTLAENLSWAALKPEYDRVLSAAS